MLLSLYRSLRSYRGFILGSVKREFQARYRNSLFGALWTVLNPLSMIIVFLVFRLIQDTKRLHDLGKPGAYVICALIPVVNLVYSGFLIFADGQPHPNEFGTDPKGRGSNIDDIADVFR